MKNHQEHEKRRKAIELYHQGKGFEKILQIIHRSRGWLSKWLGRFRERGLRGLQDQSRAPKHVWRKTPQRLEQKVLAIRKELESHKTRRSTFAGIGAEVIQWELKQRKMAPIPSISTLTRILAKHGCTKKGKKPKSSKNREPYPAFRADQMGDLHQTDLVEVDGSGYIEVNGNSYFIRRALAGQYVVTTLFTHRQNLVIKQQGRRTKSYKFPISEPRIAPLVPFSKGVRL